MTLYELTADYMALQDMMCDPEVDPEILADTLEGIEGMFEDQADCYARIIRNLEAEKTAYKEEADRIRAKAQIRDNRIKWLKDKLQYSMDLTGNRKFKTELFSFNIQKNPASLVIDEQYIENIPDEYLIEQEPVIDKAKLKAVLKEGGEKAEELEGICHLEQGESLRNR